MIQGFRKQVTLSRYFSWMHQMFFSGTQWLKGWDRTVIVKNRQNIGNTVFQDIRQWRTEPSGRGNKWGEFYDCSSLQPWEFLCYITGRGKQGEPGGIFDERAESDKTDVSRVCNTVLERRAEQKESSKNLEGPSLSFQVSTNQCM